MRTNALALIRQASAEDRSVYVLVNNRSEGNAPLTIQALVEQLRRQPPDCERTPRKGPGRASFDRASRDRYHKSRLFLEERLDHVLV